MSGSVAEITETTTPGSSSFETTLGPGDTFNEPLSEWEELGQTRSQRRQYEARKVVVREDNTMLCYFDRNVYCAEIMPHTLGVLMRPCMLQRYLRDSADKRTQAKTEQMARMCGRMDIFTGKIIATERK